MRIAANRRQHWFTALALMLAIGVLGLLVWMAIVIVIWLLGALVLGGGVVYR
jgi:hypothetical protein